MALTEQQGGQLKELLRTCTASVRIGDRSVGSAFFISNTLLLTCRHVVKDAVEVQVAPPGRPARTATVESPDPDTGEDLALLRVELQPGEEPLPSVLLHTPQLSEGAYFVAGYPREEGHEAGQEAYTVTAHRRDDDDGAPDLLQLSAGKQITYGMSGGPVLSLETGAVVAVTRTSKDPDGALGGGAIPMTKVEACFPEVAELVKDPPIAAHQWRECLGETHWRELGLPWEMATEIDLFISPVAEGSREKWCVKSEVTSEEGERLGASDLGDDVIEAMFRWAQRRRLSAKDEVNLLGRLLSKALFPSAVSSHLAVLSQADEVTVRLHIDPVPDLADIPWELACVPGHSGDFLAADPQYRLLRVDDRQKHQPPPGPSSSINVLSVIALPDQWIFPKLSFGEQQYNWPSVDTIEKGLDRLLGSPPYDTKSLVNPVLNQVFGELERQHYDVLHYIGVGYESARGSARYWLVDAYQEEATSHELTELLEKAVQHGVKLVVLEFTGPPVGQRLDPVSPSSLGDLGPIFDGNLSGLVMTRFPVHPQQFQHFNQGFYESLGRGETIPAAAQAGRCQLKEARALDDAAAFGCFTLIMGARTDVRLTFPEVVSPTERKPHSQGDEVIHETRRSRGSRGASTRRNQDVFTGVAGDDP